MKKITPVILSGGSGTRLWPVSRVLNPKQFLNFFGENSLFQETILRINDKEIFNDPVIICNEEHRFIVAEQLRKINVKAKSIILEPFGRNTAPAITIASIDVIKKLGKDNDLMLVVSSDHVIQKKHDFVNRIKDAKEILEKNNYLITFGIKPSRAETGYGYINSGKQIENSNSFLVKEFIEKPNKEKAEEFFHAENYFWNSGIFMFKASFFLDSIKKINNEILTNSQKSYDNSNVDLDFIRLSREDFELCQNISIDYAVMEKSKDVVVIPMEIGWCDVGSWDAVASLSKQDINQNSFIGDVLEIKTKNCYIKTEKTLVATIGVENLIVIALDDVVLIANKNNAQEVKQMFEILKNQKREECNAHKKVLRPWGSFETIDISDRFKAKRITVNPNCSLSLQMHHHRAEHWIVVRGVANVTCGEKEFILSEDQSTYIPIQQKHRLENKQKFPLEIIEIQTGSYLGEDDIVRFNDIYGRK